MAERVLTQTINGSDTPVGASRDAGPHQGSTREHIDPADATTAQAITSAPAAGLKAVVTDLFISAAAATLITIHTEDDAADILWRGRVSADQPYQITPRGEMKAATAAKKVMVLAADATQLYVGALWYGEV